MNKEKKMTSQVEIDKLEWEVKRQSTRRATQRENRRVRGVEVQSGATQ